MGPSMVEFLKSVYERAQSVDKFDMLAATESGPHVEHVDVVDVLGYAPQRGVRGN